MSRGESYFRVYFLKVPPRKGSGVVRSAQKKPVSLLPPLRDQQPQAVGPRGTQGGEKHHIYDSVEPLCFGNVGMSSAFL